MFPGAVLYRREMRCCTPSTSALGPIERCTETSPAQRLDSGTGLRPLLIFRHERPVRRDAQMRANQILSLI